MKPFITTLAMLAVLSTPAFAQKKKTTVRTTTKTETSAPAASSSAPVYSYSGGNSSSTSHGSGPHWSAAATLGSVDGAFTFGPSFYAEWPMTLDGNAFAFGGQTGFWFFDGGWAIPVMATGKYNFHSSGSIQPYVALSMGISILHANGTSAGTTTVGGFTITTTGSSGATNVKFSFLARPGINFGEGEKFFAELPLGVIGSGFAILPTFGYHF